MIETLEPLVKGLCIFVTAMVIFVLAVMVAYLILNMCNKADAVSVVRCRDCKHGRPYMHTKEYVSCEVDSEPIDRDSDFFCADGKRRSGE